MGLETTLMLIRHGETEWNRAGKFQGHADSPLTHRGLAQARAVALALAEEDFDAFYSSDLGRAKKTASIIADRLGRRYLTDERLREQHYGLIQGMTVNGPGNWIRLFSRGSPTAAWLPGRGKPTPAP
jgi:broad specificity phosphatase PhoE